MGPSLSKTLNRRDYLSGGVNLLAILGWVRNNRGESDAKMEEATEAARNYSSGPDAGQGETQATVGESVLVNQIGYRPNDNKIAIVRSETSSFNVIDTQTESVIHSDSLANEITDTSSGDTVHWADFSEVTDPGDYIVVTEDGADTSVEFTIAPTVWDQTLKQLCRQYTLRRSNTKIADSQIGIDIEAGHTQDSVAELYFSDEFHDEGETHDVSGGWYDAGDYGKYVPTAAITVGQLLLAYELSPDVLASVDLEFPKNILQPEGASKLPDILIESKFELEWLERMQRPDGGVYHKVAGFKWPETVPPAEDTQQRYVFGLSTFGTGLYAGVMAMASRIYEPFVPSFAAQLKQNARSAFEFLQTHEEPMFRYDEGQDAGSGPYKKETDSEERFWAAAELLQTTGEEQYNRYIESHCADQLTKQPTPIDWNSARLFGQWAYQAASNADSSLQETVRETVLSRADEIAEKIEQDGYRVSLAPDEYVWGSVKRAVSKGNVLLLANKIDANQSYTEGALAQIHYALGRTPTGQSYVTGAGKHAPENPHCRQSASLDMTIPGQVVGGPNREGNDPVLSEHIAAVDPPPAKCYVDMRKSYASNEPAIDNAAPLIFAIAAVK